MKKAIFTLAVLTMAIGTMGFAQSKTNFKSNATANVFKHYGILRESVIVPQEANYVETDGTQHRTTYYYDESEFTLSEEIMETYYDFWVNEARCLYEYDFSGNVLELLTQQWGDDDWEDEMKLSYDYNGEILNEILYQNNMDGVWTNVAKEVYNYSGDTWTVLFWIWTGTTWSSQYLYTYNRSGNTIEVLMQYMQGGAWQNESKEFYTLDFDENVTEILSQEWENNTWVNAEKTTYVFENGVYTRKLFQVWNGSSWDDEYKYAFEYDSNGNATHGECYGFDGGNWTLANGDIEMAYDYNANVVTYYGAQADLVYVDLTAVNENGQASFTVYPNPAVSEIQIQAEGFQKAEVYSLTGQKLMESINSTVDVSNLSAGVYMLKVISLDGHSATQRMVVK